MPLTSVDWNENNRPISGEKIHDAILLYLRMFGSDAAKFFSCCNCLIIMLSWATISSSLFNARSVYVVLLASTESDVEIGTNSSLLSLNTKTWVSELCFENLFYIESELLKEWIVTPPISIHPIRAWFGWIYADKQVFVKNLSNFGNSMSCTPASRK